MVYTNSMRKAVHSIKVPVDGFKMDIVEFSEIQPAIIMLRFYYSQWITFNDSERTKLLFYMDKVRKIIEAHGVRTTLDPVYDTPVQET